MPVDPEPFALCTVDDVKTFSNLQDELDPAMQQKVDDLLQRLVNSASDLFLRAADREFLPYGKAGSRLFQVDEGFSMSRTVKTDDFTGAPTLVRILDSFRQVFAPAVVSGAFGYDLEPANVDPTREPYYRIVFRPEVALPLQWSGIGQPYVEVTAAWGWPKVPAAAHTAVVEAVSTWWARDVEKFSATFSNELGRIVVPRKLPDHVLDVAEDFRNIGVV